MLECQETSLLYRVCGCNYLSEIFTLPISSNVINFQSNCHIKLELSFRGVTDSSIMTCFFFFFEALPQKMVLDKVIYLTSQSIFHMLYFFYYYSKEPFLLLLGHQNEEEHSIKIHVLKKNGLR